MTDTPKSLIDSDFEANYAESVKNLIFILVFASSLRLLAATNCAKEGEGWNPMMPGEVIRCCKGLVEAMQWDEGMKDCKAIPPPGTQGGYCVKCGDSKCDKAHYESKCNCPKDCK